jgi:ubiquitin conjugation factor E4 B
MHFSNPDNRRKADMEANQVGLRMTLDALQVSSLRRWTNVSSLTWPTPVPQNNLFSIYNAIIRASPESREAVLSFFADVLTKNVKRSGMRVSTGYAFPLRASYRLNLLFTSQVDPKKVATDGFMINIQTILLRLFEPVMDVSFTKIDKVDPDYYRVSRRLDIKEETKIRATQEEANEYYAPKDGMDVDSGGSRREHPTLRRD